MRDLPCLFSDLNAPYYIDAPPFRENSGGVRALHYLCHALNLIGEEAYVTTNVVSPALRTPIATSEIQRKHQSEGRYPIVVYPEVISGNPQKARHVVRYLLNIPGLLTGTPPVWGADDLVYSHGVEAVPEGMEAQLLRVPLIDTRIFNTDGVDDSKRSGGLLLIHRYLDRGGLLDDVTMGCTEISMRVPHRTPVELAALYRTAECLYTYEPSTACYEAQACGCPVVYLPNDILLPKPIGGYLPNAGYAWGRSEEQLAHAKATIKDIPGILAAIEREFWGELHAFIEATQRHARRPLPVVSPHTEGPVSEALIRTNDAGRPVGGGGCRKRRLVICGIETPKNACPNIRLIAPFSFYPDDWELVWGIVNNGLDLAILREADVILLHRFMPGLCSPELLKAIFDLGKPVIYETDDLLTEVPDGIPNAEYMRRGKPGIEYAIRHANAVVVSTQFIADKYKTLNPNVHVLINFLDFDRFYRPVPLQSGEKISIGLVGTSLMPYNFALVDAVLRSLCERYPGRIRLCCIGHEVPPGWHGHPALEFQPVLHDYHDYVDWMLAQRLDIALIPLVDDAFNSSKSVIKWMEYSAAGLVSVFSNVSTYRTVVDSGRNGLLVEDKPEAWLAAIESLLCNPSLRRQMARTAQAEVRKHFSLSENAWRYHQTYLRCIGAVAQANAVQPPAGPSRVLGVLMLDGEGSAQKVQQSLHILANSPFQELPVIILTTQLGELPEWTDSLRYVQTNPDEYAQSVEQLSALADFEWAIIMEAGL